MSNIEKWEIIYVKHRKVENDLFHRKWYCMEITKDFEMSTVVFSKSLFILKYEWKYFIAHL